MSSNQPARPKPSASSSSHHRSSGSSGSSSHRHHSSSSGSGAGAASSSSSSGSNFAWKVRYTNPLPPPPVPPKLVPVPSLGSHTSDARLARYVHGATAQSQPFPPYIDADLGAPIDLVQLGVFDKQHDPVLASGVAIPLDPLDEFLLTPPLAPGAQAASAEIARNANFLVKNPLGSPGQSASPSIRPAISAHGAAGAVKPAQVRNGSVGPGAVSTQGGLAAENDPNAPSAAVLGFDRSITSQMELISESFEKSARVVPDPRIRHPTNAKVHAVEVYDIFFHDPAANSTGEDASAGGAGLTLLDLQWLPDLRPLVKGSSASSSTLSDQNATTAITSNSFFRPFVPPKNAGPEVERFVSMYVPSDMNSVQDMQKLTNATKPSAADAESAEPQSSFGMAHVGDYHMENVTVAPGTAVLTLRKTQQQSQTQPQTQTQTQSQRPGMPARKIPIRGKGLVTPIKYQLRLNRLRGQYVDPIHRDPYRPKVLDIDILKS